MGLLIYTNRMKARGVLGTWKCPNHTFARGRILATGVNGFVTFFFNMLSQLNTVNTILSLTLKLWGLLCKHVRYEVSHTGRNIDVSFIHLKPEREFPPIQSEREREREHGVNSETFFLPAP